MTRIRAVLPPTAPRGRGRGFTLIELIMTLLLVGILAAFVSARLSGTEFNERGFHDGTLAYLRYAQKVAIAQRRTVCVSFTANSVSLSVASVPASYDCAVAATLIGPRSETPASLSAPSGVSYSGVPSGFNFDSLGRAIDSSGALLPSQSIQVSGMSLTVTVESGTGYIHD